MKRDDENYMNQFWEVEFLHNLSQRGKEVDLIKKETKEVDGTWYIVCLNPNKIRIARDVGLVVSCYTTATVALSDSNVDGCGLFWGISSLS